MGTIIRLEQTSCCLMRVNVICMHVNLVIFEKQPKNLTTTTTIHTSNSNLSLVHANTDRFLYHVPHTTIITHPTSHMKFVLFVDLKRSLFSLLNFPPHCSPSLMPSHLWKMVILQCKENAD